MSRTNYRKIYEQFHNTKLDDGIEIHHVDGNKQNNDITNLKAVTIEEHLEIHYKQRDWCAVQAILVRMSMDSEQLRQMSSEYARAYQNSLLEKGSHNFQLLDENRRKEISRKAGVQTLLQQKGIHAINADPSLSKSNGRKAGLISKEKKAGFHNPEKSGSNYVRNTVWWTNKVTKEHRRSKMSPGTDWIKGMKYED